MWWIIGLTIGCLLCAYWILWQARRDAKNHPTPEDSYKYRRALSREDIKKEIEMDIKKWEAVHLQKKAQAIKKERETN